MSIYYDIKHWLKIVRWQGRRFFAGLRWGPQNLGHAPIVIGNAMPKAGSHLIIQVLQGLTRLGPFVNPGFPPLNRTEDNCILGEAHILENIQRMRPGDIAYGYLPAHEPFLSALAQASHATIFVYRDPRDLIVSHVFYATEIHPGHGMHRYYTETLRNMEERINAAIRGVTEPGSQLPGVRERYLAYLGWLQQPAVLCLRFEDLILERESALGCLLDYLEGCGFHPQGSREQAVDVLKQAILPHRSGTFRRGMPGNWQEYFTPANKTLFKECCGDLLIQLGYAPDYAW
jgi:hypothetical protein